MTGMALQSLRQMRTAIADALYPPACLVCAEPVGDAQALCVTCWNDTYLIDGTACDGCGAPLDIALGPGEAIRCEVCRRGAALWHRGRAAALYSGGARALILALKHGDRPDIAQTLAVWMARAAADVLRDADLIVPVPLHWTRFLSRRFNQSAELSREIARLAARSHAPGLLRRVRPTEMQRARSHHARRRNVDRAFAVPAHLAPSVKGRCIALIDDVMTTGATLNAATSALLTAGAARVDTVVFARVAREAQPVT